MGLADSEELICKRKKIIHSTRSWHGLDERAIRKIFASHRRAEALQIRAHPAFGPRGFDSDSRRFDPLRFRKSCRLPLGRYVPLIFC